MYHNVTEHWNLFITK